MDGVQLPQGLSHFEEAVYFLPTLFASCPPAPAAILYVLPIISFLYLKAFELTTFLLAKLLGLLSSLNSSL